MASAGFQDGFVSRLVYRGLFHENGRYGFEGYTEIDVFAVADSPLDASRTVGAQGDASAFVIEQIVLLASLQIHASESLPVFEPFGGVDAQHGVPQCGMKFPEYGLSQSNGASSDDAAHYASDGISFALYTQDKLFHLPCQFRVGTTHGIPFDAPEVVLCIVFIQSQGSHLRSECRYLHANFFQCQFG